jgi:DNA mismatch endonuclease (patch repair protein)
MESVTRITTDYGTTEYPDQDGRYDSLSVAERSHRMSLIKHSDTRPEMTVRRIIHGMGYRYRLHDKKLPGKPDLVFKSRRKVIFVNGCFWHLHDCGTYNVPKSRIEFWMPKLKRNAERDREVRRELEASGWKHLTIWECELRDQERIAQRIREFLQ